MRLGSRSSHRPLAALAGALAFAAVTAAAPASFHLHLVKSAPEPNASVNAAPPAIQLWFSQAPELAVTTVKVTGPVPSSAIIPTAKPVAGDSGLVVAGVTGTMLPGRYSVAWRTMARDGHVVHGTFAFTITTSR